MSARALHLDFPRGGARVAFWPVAVAAGTAVFSAAAAVILGPAALALPFGLALVAVLVRYPTALLVIYGYIGIFKGEPLVADLPFDVTLALGVLLALVCLHRLIEGRVRPVPAAYLALLLLIGCMLAVSLTWTPMAEYGTEKVLKFFSLHGARRPRAVLHHRGPARPDAAALGDGGIGGFQCRRGSR